MEFKGQASSHSARRSLGACAAVMLVAGLNGALAITAPAATSTSGASNATAAAGQSNMPARASHIGPESLVSPLSSPSTTAAPAADPAGPVVKEVHPHAGPIAGETIVTIKGEGFVEGETFVEFGVGNPVPLERVMVISSTELVVEGNPVSPIPGVRHTGVVPVIVEVQGHRSNEEDCEASPQPPGCFAYVATPAITGVEARGGGAGGGSSVRITGLPYGSVGTQFIEGETTVKFGETPATIKHLSPTELEVEAPAHAKGTVPVTVKAPGGTSSTPNCEASPEPTACYSFGLPVVEHVEASGGSTTGGEQVTIRGHGFKDYGAGGAGHEASGVKFGGSAVSCEGASAPCRVLSDEEIKVAAPAHEKGVVDVTVTTPEGESPKSEADHYAFGQLFVSAVTPAEGSLEGASKLTIRGANLEGVKKVLFNYTGAVGVPERHVPAESIEVISPTEIRVITPGAEWNEGGTGGSELLEGTITVENEGEVGKSNFLFFSPPRVARVQPDQGPTTGGTAVHLIVFVAMPQAISALKFGGSEVPSSDFTVKELQKVGLTAIDEVDVIAPAHAAGTVDVTASTAGSRGEILPSDRFTYLAPSATLPVVEAVEPGEGPSAGSTSVKIKGQHFVEGETTVKFGETAAAIKHLSPTEIEVEAPAHAVGRVDVTVTTPQGASPVSAGDRFLYQGYGVESFEALPCKGPSELGAAFELGACSYLGGPEQAFTQASGLAPYFVLGFSMDSREVQPHLNGNQMVEDPGLRVPSGGAEGGHVAAPEHLRVDLPPGLAFDPSAVTQCNASTNSAVGFVTRAQELDNCGAESQVGVETVDFVSGGAGGTSFESGEFRSFPVFDLKPEPGVPAEFGFDVTCPEHSAPGVPVYLRGDVSWHREAGTPNGVGSGDFHAYSETYSPNTNRENKLPCSGLSGVLASKIIFNTTAVSPDGHHFIQLPSECQKGLTYHIRLNSTQSETAEASTTTPTGVEGCNKVPFNPEISVAPGTAHPSESQPGQPDGASVTVKLPQNLEPINSADPHEVTVTLPEGMTVNPSQANTLSGEKEAERSCSEEEFGVEPGPDGRFVIKEGSGPGGAAPIGCDPHTKLGTFEVRTPDLPQEETEGHRGQLRGNVYLARPVPGAEPESGEEYRVFLSAESQKYGVAVRLLGHVRANKQTGRLSTTLQTPQLPFEESITRFDSEEQGGPEPTSAPLANPLACGTTESLFVPYGGPEGPANASPSSPFTLAGCPFPPPFSLGQAAAVSSTQAGLDPAFTLKWTRGPEQQYLVGTKTTLPPGLVGSIADVPALCEEAQANAGSCPAGSQIGVVRSASGAGTPYVLGGQVYLTGPYQGAPYGLAIVVPAEHVGPYDYGKIVSRARIEINPETAQVTTTASVPAIVGGAPVRLREVEVTLNKEGFMRNPTNCSPLSIESTLYGTDSSNLANPPATASQQLNTPFQVTGCSALPFKPTFSSQTSAQTSRQDGASLRVKISQRPGEANIHAVETQLPYALPSRLTTLQKACTESQFAQNPAGCPAAAFVGTATAVTPLLRAPLTGRAILVSHGGREFPDLKFLLEGENGIKINLTGHTDIKKGITYTRFETVPDSPISSFETYFPTGPYSALGANGSFCTETVTSKERVPLRNKHGRVVRRHGHIVYTTIGKLTRHVPASLYMPTTITGQNGAKVSQKTKIEVTGCGASVKSPNVLSDHVKGHTLILKLKTAAKGTLTVSGRGLKTTRKTLAAGTHTLKVRLSKAGIRLARHHQKITVKLTLKAASASSSSTLPVKL